MTANEWPLNDQSMQAGGVLVLAFPFATQEFAFGDLLFCSFWYTIVQLRAVQLYLLEQHKPGSWKVE